MSNALYQWNYYQPNNNLGIYGKFCIQNENIILGTSSTNIPITRTQTNINNFCKINSDGTIVVPAGTYIINISLHGVINPNDIVQIYLYCGNSTATTSLNWTKVSQFTDGITLIAKNIKAETVRLAGKSEAGTSFLFGYNTSPAGTLLMIQKII